MTGERRQGLQALRGIAALLVFVHHIEWGASVVMPIGDLTIRMGLGTFGVLIFFALSGYLMTYSIAGASPGKFAVDRLRRIYPGFWIAVALTAILSWTIVGWPVTFSAGLFALFPTGAYMEVLIPYWTLLYEMAFYVLCWLAILIARRFAIHVVIAALAVSYLFAARPFDWAETAAADLREVGFSLYALVFLAGVLAGRFRIALPPAAAVALAALGTLIYFGPWLLAELGVLLPVPAGAESDVAALRWALSAGCVLVAALAWSAAGRVGRLFARFGDASYGIYLIHIIMLFTTAHVLKGLGASGWPPWLFILLLSVPAFVLSYALGVAEWRLQDKLKQFVRWPPALRGKMAAITTSAPP